jgi:hypothetical protein
MNHWESKIDPTHFGLLASYLRSPTTPIDFILHVKHEPLLAEVALQIERDRFAGVPEAPPLSPGLLALVREGTLQVSSLKDPGPVDPGAMIDVSQVRSSADTRVIYLPPFYVAHTPGLFEGKVMREAPRERHHIQEVDNSLWEGTIPDWKDRDCGQEY